MFRKIVSTTVFVFLVCGLVYSKEVCIVERSDVISRIENREFPSVFGAWDFNIINRDKPTDIHEWQYLKTMLARNVKCHRLFRPQFRKVKTSFVVEIREVSNTLTLNAGVSGDTLV